MLIVIPLYTIIISAHRNNVKHISVFLRNFYRHLYSCCSLIKYRTAYLIKSSTVISSFRIVNTAKQSVIAAGISMPSFTSSTIDISVSTQRIIKSFKPHSHRFAFARRFFGYKYCFIFPSPISPPAEKFAQPMYVPSRIRRVFEIGMPCLRSFIAYGI